MFCGFPGPPLRATGSVTLWLYWRALTRSWKLRNYWYTWSTMCQSINCLKKNMVGVKKTALKIFHPSMCPGSVNQQFIHLPSLALPHQENPLLLLRQRKRGVISGATGRPWFRDLAPISRARMLVFTKLQTYQWTREWFWQFEGPYKMAD